MIADVATAMVTERSEAMLRFTYLGYFSILGVMNNLRQTLPILSATHRRSLGYMVDDVVKYNESLKRVAVTLGTTTGKVHEMGVKAREVGIREEEVYRMYENISTIRGQKMMSIGGFYRATRYEMFLQAIGLDRDKLAKVPEKEQNEYIMKFLANVYAGRRRAEGQQATTNLFRRMEQIGGIGPGETETIAAMSERMGTPAQAKYRLEQYQQAQKFRQDAAKAAGGVLSFIPGFGVGKQQKEYNEFLEKQKAATKEGAGLFSKDTEEDIRQFRDAIADLNKTFDALKLKLTEIIVRVNMPIFTVVLKAINYVAEGALKLAGYIDRLSRVFETLFNLPMMGFISGLLKVIALAVFWGTIFPNIISGIIGKLGLAGGAFELFGMSAANSMKYMLSPIHMVMGAVQMLAQLVVRLGITLNWMPLRDAAAKMAVLAGATSISSTGFGSLGAGIKIAATGLWTFIKQTLLFAAATFVIIETINGIIYVIKKLAGSADEYEMGISKIYKLFNSFNATNDLTQAQDEAIKKFNDMGKASDRTTQTIANNLMGLSKQDLFGDLLDQVVNLPERFIPKMMNIISTQVKASKSQLIEAQYFGLIDMNQTIDVKFTDVLGNQVDQITTRGGSGLGAGF